MTGKGLASRYAAIFIVLLVIGAGVSAAILAGSTSSPALETVTPADSAAFLRVAVRPEGDQLDSLRALLAKLPAQQRTALQSQVDSLFEKAARGGGFDFNKDIKPWLGSQIGFSMRPATSGPPQLVAMIQVKDESAARASLTKLAAAAHNAVVFEIDNGVAYVSQSTQAITAYRAAAKANPLSDDPTFRAQLDKVGDGLLVFYFDGARLGGLARGLPVPGLAQQFSTLSGAKALIALQVKSDGIALAGHASGVPDIGLKAGKPALVESTSSGLLGEATLFDVGGILDRLQMFGGQIPGFASKRAEVIAKVKQLTGLDLENDVIPWLHGELSIVAGGITPSAADVAVMIQPTDATALARTLATLKAHAAQLGAKAHATITQVGTGFDVNPSNGPTIAVRVGTDRLVIAADPAYADELMKPSSQALANDLLYRELMGGSGNVVTSQLFVRVDRIRTLVEAVLSGDRRTSYEQNVKPYLEPFQALVARSTLSGGEADFLFELSVSK